MTLTEIESEIRAIKRTCKGRVRQYQGKLVRIRCGFDVNDLILQQPFDGEARIITCPRCGQKINITSPYFI